MSNPGAKVGDEVTFVFGNEDSISGTLKSRPVATGDTWVVHTKSGTIYEVQHFDSMSVDDRKAGEK